MRFCPCKTILGAHLYKWEIMYIKEQISTLLIITYGGSNCTKQYFSFPADYTISVYMMSIPHFCSLYTTQSIYIAALPFLINWNEKQCSKSNILTMDYNLVLGNSSPADVYTLLNTITRYITGLSSMRWSHA